MKNAFLTAALLSAAAITTPACAQKGNAQKTDAEKHQQQQKGAITSQTLAPGIAVLFGEGGNTGLSFGEDGTVMIDDKFARSTAAIQAAVKDLGAEPVKFLINTHWHGDHAGGNENFAKAGSIIIAHDNVRSRLANGREGARPVKPAPAAALPVVTYAKGAKLHLNGEEIHLIALPPAHTDGDTIVHWTKSNIFHMGDTYFNTVTLPFVDLNSGADARGFVTAADTVLALADDNSQIIPGHGKMATKADLQEYRDMVAEIISKVERGIKAGKTLKQIQAEKPADGYDVNTSGFITPDRFVGMVYNSLNKK